MGDQENDNKKEPLEFEIEDAEFVEETQDDGFDIEGLMPEEIEMAKNTGLYKEPEEGEDDGEHKKSDKPTTEKNKSEQKEEVKAEVNTDPDNFEEMESIHEKDEKAFHEKFTPNQKALYFKNKIEKKKRQEIQKERDDLKQKLEMVKDSSLSQAKIDKIAKMLKEDVDNLTIEGLQRIIEEKSTIAEEKEPQAVDINKLQQKISERIIFAESIGKSQYENFENLVKLAGEMFRDKPRYQKQFDSMLTDNNIDENEIVDFVVDIAKLNKNYNVQKVDPVVKNKVDRVLKNSQKKVSSASVTGASGRRVVSEDELTCDDASKLPISQWSKLKESTRQRILKGIDP